MKHIKKQFKILNKMVQEPSTSKNGIMYSIMRVAKMLIEGSDSYA